jgi:hypothetical protein
MNLKYIAQFSKRAREKYCNTHTGTTIFASRRRRELKRILTMSMIRPMWNWHTEILSDCISAIFWFWSLAFQGEHHTTIEAKTVVVPL